MAGSESVRDVLGRVQRRLAAAGVTEAPLEAQVLVMHVTGMSRAELYAALPDPFPPHALQPLDQAVSRRIAREPLAYITGHREFFGLDLAVDARVLVPRPETETVVEHVIDVAGMNYSGKACAIADVGTGSGAIAISLASALPRARIYATDISLEALDLARQNCQRHGLGGRVTLLPGDLLEPVGVPLDIVVANLPYVAEDEWPGLQPEIRLFEPRGAVISGPAGLDHLFRLLGQVRGRQPRPAWVVLEMRPGQAAAVIQEARRLFPVREARAFNDLQGLERGVILGVDVREEI